MDYPLMRLQELAKDYNVRDYSRLADELRQIGLSVNVYFDLPARQIKTAREYIKNEYYEPPLIQCRVRPPVNMNENSLADSFKPFGILLPEETLLLLNYLKDNSAKTAYVPTVEVILESKYIIEQRPIQFYSILRKGKITFLDPQDWQYKVKLMWIAAELACKERCLKNNLNIVDLNEINLMDEHDFIIEGKHIDVKARCKIGAVVDWNLNRGYFKDNEIIAFFHTEENQYDSSIISKPIGIYDPAVIELLNLKFVTTKIRPDLNPLYFIDFKYYFNLTNKKSSPLVSKKIIRFLIEEDRIHIPKLIHYYDQLSCLKALHEEGYFQEHESLIERMISLYKKGTPHYAPLILLEYVLGIIGSNRRIKSPIKRILPFCFLNEIQAQYIKHLLQVIYILQSENHRCKFKNIPLKNCKISFLDNTTIIATAPGAHRSNTLLSHSWFDGRTVSYGSEGVSVCDSIECGCLLHNSHELKIGRKKCPKHGKKSVLRKRDKVYSPLTPL